MGWPPSLTKSINVLCFNFTVTCKGKVYKYINIIIVQIIDKIMFSEHNRGVPKNSTF